MELLRQPGRLAPWLVLIPVTCAWPAIAHADPPSQPGSEVIDPWADATHAATGRWRGPSESEVIDPWHDSHAKSSETGEPFIVDPWPQHASRVPTAAFPPLDVIDPWSH